MLLTVLELISQSSNFSRITILRNSVFLPFSPIYLANMSFFSDKKDIFAKYRWKNAISQNSNSGKITTLRNEF